VALSGGSDVGGAGRAADGGKRSSHAGLIVAQDSGA
jgi:hypothetical protein